MHQKGFTGFSVTFFGTTQEKWVLVLLVMATKIRPTVMTMTELLTMVVVVVKVLLFLCHLDNELLGVAVMMVLFL